jgi:hypothetical protein
VSNVIDESDFRYYRAKSCEVKEGNMSIYIIKCLAVDPTLQYSSRSIDTVLGSVGYIETSVANLMGCKKPAIPTYLWMNCVQFAKCNSNVWALRGLIGATMGAAPIKFEIG